MEPVSLRIICRMEYLFHFLKFNKGQSLVEFTLGFMLFLVIAWIPADFGLAFFSGQLAQNAAREGARIAAADPNLASGSCTMPCSSAAAGTALKAAADRLSPALLPGATITITYPVAGGAVCNQMVRVQVQGVYTYFFYPIVRIFGVTGNLNTMNIDRQTDMRWEHQQFCLGA
jgi:TadE-like protein